MSSDTIYRFEKTSGCPPSEELLSFSLAALHESSLKKVSRSEMCDICSSEAHFFSKQINGFIPFTADEDAAASSRACRLFVA
jgi:hypothetical protein